MTSLAWYCAGFGTAIAVVILLAIVVDVAFLTAGEPTITERCMVAGQRYPAVAVLLTAVILAPPLILVGHLFLGPRG